LVRFIAAAAIALGAVLLATNPPGGDDEPRNLRSLLEPRSPYSQPRVLVRAYDYGFEPRRVRILAGQAVGWRNVGKAHHVVTPSSAAGRRVFEAAEREGSASHVFTRPGDYRYYCALHARMRGTVVVSPNRASQRPSRAGY
jgi:plastocyanin